jgi:serine/threonine-protein phosphatase PGAM5
MSLRTAAGAAFGFGASLAAAARAAHCRADDDRHKKTWGVPWIDDWDRPSWQHKRKGQVSFASQKVKRQIFLVRHGQYCNEGQHDDEKRYLTPLGEEQAALTGKYLGELLRASGVVADSQLSAIHVSDMTRAKQTADLIVANIDPAALKRGVAPAQDAKLRELFPCDPQPPYHKSAKLKNEIAVEEAFAKYFHRPADGDASSAELIVGHANVIRYMLCRALQVPPEAWLRFSLPHCSVTCITVGGTGKVSVQGVGAAGHLPAAKMSVNNVK